MRKTVKIIIITAALLLLVGFSVAAGLMMFGGRDDGADGSMVLERNDHEISENFDRIRIDTTIADIKLLPSDDGNSRVECLEFSKARHDVAVSDGKLEILIDDRRTLLDQAVITSENPHVYVYLSENVYTALAVNGHTGMISVEDDFEFDSIDITSTTGAVTLNGVMADKVTVTATTGAVYLGDTEVVEASVLVTTGTVTVGTLKCRGRLNVSATTGSVMIENVTCGSFYSDGSTGGITLSQVTAEGEMKITRKTGGVTFDGADAAEMDIETTTGSVRGSLLTGKTFSASTTTGGIKLPPNTSESHCRIRTTTGGINITVKG